MSAIHYKLKSAKDYDTYRFDGAGIPVWELKNEIIEKKKLGKSDDFDLVILNAQTSEGTLPSSQMFCDKLICLSWFRVSR
jgi:E3 ubiquitin-protein ligase RBBP6